MLSKLDLNEKRTATKVVILVVIWLIVLDLNEKRTATFTTEIVQIVQ